jgi:hypothetical protein
MNSGWAAFTSRPLRDTTMVINTHVIVVMRRRPSPARAGHLASGHREADILPGTSCGWNAKSKEVPPCQAGDAAVIDAFRDRRAARAGQAPPTLDELRAGFAPAGRAAGSDGARLARLPDPPTAPAPRRMLDSPGPRICSLGQRRAVRLAGISWDPGRCAPSVGWCPSPRRRTRRTGARDCPGR